MKKYVIVWAVFLAVVLLLYGGGAGKAQNDGMIIPEECYKNTLAETGISEIVSIGTLPLPPYVAPDGWYVPRFTTGAVSGGDYNLVPEVMGLKVYYVQKKFKLSPERWGYYRDETISKVASFQKKNGIKPTGNVNLETWLALGFDEKSWNELGIYITPVKINEKTTREEMINVFIDTAKEYLGTPYVVGAAGKPGEGVDCSGLILQCLYAIGIYPDGLDPVQHSTLEEYNSRLMWADKKFKKVSYSELEAGDLVFYRRPWSNKVCHAAIYLGENKCIEALKDKVEILPLDKAYNDYAIMGYKRVIAN